jgi:predicted CoA-binding protein
MHENPSVDALRTLLEAANTIAVVGASGNPERPSYAVMRVLQHAGYRVIPINPRETEILGEQAYASLADVPVPIDIVDVFRKAEDTPPIADDAVRAGARVLWLQAGISSDEAAARAVAGGLIVVMDLCIGATVAHLGISKRPH